MEMVVRKTFTGIFNFFQDSFFSWHLWIAACANTYSEICAIFFQQNVQNMGNAVVAPC